LLPYTGALALDPMGDFHPQNPPFGPFEKFLDPTPWTSLEAQPQALARAMCPCPIDFLKPEPSVQWHVYQNEKSLLAD